MSVPQHIERPIPPARVSDLVLVDQHEAQGWRVRRDERLDQLFERHCDWISDYGRADRLAVDSDELSLTYAELDARANRLARYLRLRGAGGGDRIALLFDSAAHSYVAMLAVLKIGATYVPLDVASSTGRLAYIVEDSRAHTVLSMSRVAGRVPQIELLTASGADLVHVDLLERLLEEMNPGRLLDADRGTRENPLAYISYASVSGRPEGVAIDHASICNFVKVAAEIYRFRPTDRVYQGMAIAFDFSVEEIWVPWVSGATLVPRPAGPALLGDDLGTFLADRRVTALCTVPEVLDTIGEDLPGLRFLLMCGKDAPAETIARWHRPGRRFLNVYGPTEATVTATWSELRPDRPATIGIPLPTYSTVVLDVGDPYRALPHGHVGEIGIAGIGLACGYLNHDDLTDQVFVRDFLGIPGNPSGRIYRTGDLGVVNADGELEYRGRVDGRTQTRDDRVEPALTTPLPVVPAAALAPAPVAVAPTTEAALGEVLADVLDMTRVPPEQHFFDDLGADSMVMARFCARARRHPGLPPVSMKDVYRYPSVRALASALADDGSSPAERSLLEVLGEVLGTPVTADAHFFDDLGADSMTMARFCARLRKRVDLPPVSMKDVYAHSTIRGLATALAGPGSATASTAGPAASAPAVPLDLPEPVGTPRFVLCGALQLLFYLGYSALAAVLALRGYEWVSAGVGLLDQYLRALAAGVVGFTGVCALPIALKWALVGRWAPARIRVWSMSYLRFWIVRTLVRSNPLVLFLGSPIYTFYLRALGADVGRGVAIFSRNVPVCTDLLTVGDGTVIRKDSFVSCYRAHDGVIEIGAVTLGADVVVGEKTVLDIGTAMGDGALLGHTSSLQTGQAVPAGQSWHGSPAQHTDSDYRSLVPEPCGTPRRVLYAVVQLVNLLVVSLPLVLGGVALALTEVPQLAALLDRTAPAFTSTAFYTEALLASAVLFFGGALLTFLLMVTVPRVLAPTLTPDRTYRLYGFHYWAHRLIAKMTNRKFFTELFGDSSFITGYLGAIGYRLSPVVQTGSNFGMAVQHESPFLSSVGHATVVADGLSIVNADFSASSFRVSPTSIGADNFLGNHIAYPSQGRTGDNCLLATKVMVPIDGPVRTGVGLLGSPSFEIPRSVDRDTGFDLPPDEMRRRLAGKNRHNAVTIALRLVVRWMHLFGILLIASGASDLAATYGAAAYAAIPVATLAFTVVYYVAVERAVDVLQTLAPDGCSIYDPVFWRHERAWKVPSETYFKTFDGTPFKTVLWRLLGVRIGRRVFDDGCFLTERSFTAIGDGATLNAGTIVQCHSQEDGAFKSDRTTIGAGVTLGVGAFVHYGVTIGNAAVLAADSFLMKGEDVPSGTSWGGNPAGELAVPTHDAGARHAAA
ncbi:Pls/PosA family non-ribosomal peptide synthetase [Pseudonocardia sediminis]|uniref:Pls/PosA family non-ribosomal peptide synthetase n=1 Tax=Pseudonocardia sediminis TaxID=1397368 RepID=UPI001F5F2507|nr:Pls/PosA family non-ribosomal peptide synthetase [Pseudonocardia sediminis]